MTGTTTTAKGRGLLIVAAVVALAAASTLAVAAASGAFRHRHTAQGTTCAAPALPGTVVDVSLIDMNGMGGMMRGGQSGWRTWHRGMMRVTASTQNAPAGTVSLRVTNQGVITHELVVLPLAAAQSIGTRTVGQDGKVDETGSLGEVSKTCAGGAGDGLSPGSTGWATLTLPAGRYELVCNLPGHYTAGMYTELDVS
jgi:uncharacterized cupredoxin-like copper-binding protein